MNGGGDMSSDAVKYKSQLYAELARVGKGLSSDKRLEILDLLTQAPKTVEHIAKETGISVANTSRHLQILKDSRLVTMTRDGNHIIYNLSAPQITSLVRLLITVGENELSEMRAIQVTADNQKNVKTISLEQVRQTYRQSYILDIRPRDEYAAGHIKTATNIPLEELTDNLDKLPKQQQIIVYCRGRLCPNANIASQILNENGYNAFSLNYSYYDWQDDIKE